MLGFIAMRNQIENKKAQTKERVCKAINEAWTLADDIGEMGAELAGEGWGDAESACHIKDQKASDQMGEMAAKYTAMGMNFSEASCHLTDKIEAIAKDTGCKLKSRPQGG